MTTGVGTKVQRLPAAAPVELGFSAARIRVLLGALQDEIDRKRLPGAVALIARQGKIALFESLGSQVPVTPAHGSAQASAQAEAPAPGPTPMARDSLFRIYSMTKPVVSVAVMMLVEQGKLLLSDPVHKHLPEFAAQQVMTTASASMTNVQAASQLAPVQRAATVQDLLRHTAGLTYEFLGNNPVQKLYTQARIRTDLRERSNAEFSATLATLPLIAEPATVWEYSRATDVLGRLVEVISGQTLRAYLQDHIFAPLGMTDTDFSVPPEHHHRIAEPFARDPDGAPRMRVFNARESAAFESGGGGLVSTAMDYARFLQFMLNRGELDGVRLLGPRTVDFMTADHMGAIPVNAGGSSNLLLPGYGFGLGFAVRTALGIASEPGSVGLYYWGGLAGTTFFVDPVEDLFGILMIQAPNQREHYRHLFRNMVYAALVD